MNKKIYYQNPYIKTFNTEVKKQDKDDQGREYIILEATCFYPTGGGQPSDKGTINNVDVENVEEVDGEIRHFISNPLMLDQNKGVTGYIDWERRFDHMQQHAGQHILSAAFLLEFNYPTVGFHLGEEILTIDLDTANLSDEAAIKAEERANDIVLQNKPIETKWVTEEELIHYPIVKSPAVKENIRLVIIPEYDYNGCGGTHPSTTGQVGGIKIIGWERQRKRIRVQFICGNRILLQLHKKNGIIAELNKLLNSPEDEIVNRVKRILQSEIQLVKLNEEAIVTLMEYEADSLLKKTEVLHSQRTVRCVFKDRSIQQMQKLAKTIISKVDDIFVFFVSKENEKLVFVCACSSDVTIPLKISVQELLSLINGKGGGSDTFTQGSGVFTLSCDAFLEIGVNKILNKGEANID